MPLAEVAWLPLLPSHFCRRPLPSRSTFRFARITTCTAGFMEAQRRTHVAAGVCVHAIGLAFQPQVIESPGQVLVLCKHRGHRSVFPGEVLQMRSHRHASQLVLVAASASRAATATRGRCPPPADDPRGAAPAHADDGRRCCHGRRHGGCRHMAISLSGRCTPFRFAPVAAAKDLVPTLFPFLAPREGSATCNAILRGEVVRVSEAIFAAATTSLPHQGDQMNSSRRY
mmetsp:Transcript_85573/g.238904  ORF Transcript_85573/g.238904 Transcript_85573/m.238904 type:complete len:228 (-) Transcript_85573:117-800(-)